MMQAIDARLKRALKPGKRILVILSAVIVVLIAAAVVAGYGVVQNARNASGLRQDAINGCNLNNSQKSQLDELLNREGQSQAQITETAITEFIDVLEGAHPSAEVLTIAKNLEAEIRNSSNESIASLKKQLDAATAPRNCQAAYSNIGGGDPKSLPPGTPKEMVASSETVELLNWDGYCLTSPNDNVGARITQSSCSSAHKWVYYPASGYLSPSGHSSVYVGDVGGVMELKSTPIAIRTDVQKDNGPNGYTYDRMWFGVSGTYWHGGGNGQYVTLTGSPGSSLAVYWAILGTGEQVSSSGMV
jgi:uncharacterized membrane protein